MPEDPKIPITAKLPKPLHDKITQAVESKDFKDKTDCITQALEKLLCNTHQTPLFNEDVIREKDKEILRITQELRATQAKLDELQEVLRVLPKPEDNAVLRAQVEGLHVLLDEKDKRIEGFEREVTRLDSVVNTLDMYAHYFKSREIVQQVQEPCNTEVTRSNTVSNGLMEKKCKNCNNTFFTGNFRKEFCSGRCKTAYGRKMKKER